MCATCNLGRFFGWHQKMVGTETWDFHQFSPLFPPPPVEREMNLQSLGILRQFSETTTVFFWGGGNLKSLLPKGKITQKEVVFFCLKRWLFSAFLGFESYCYPWNWWWLQPTHQATNCETTLVARGGSHENVTKKFPQENNAQIYCKCQQSHKFPPYI